MADTIQQFVSSFNRINGLGNASSEFFDAFYRLFVDSSAEVAEKFRDTDMAAQREMLRSSLDHMIYFAIDKEETAEILRVAEAHGRSSADIPSRLYDLWLESLIETVRQFDPEHNPDVEAAWRDALTPAIAYMKGHHDSQ